MCISGRGREDLLESGSGDSLWAEEKPAEGERQGCGRPGRVKTKTEIAPKGSLEQSLSNR